MRVQESLNNEDSPICFGSMVTAETGHAVSKGLFQNLIRSIVKGVQMSPDFSETCAQMLHLIYVVCSP